MSDIADTFEAGGVVQARTTATIMARILAPVREIRAVPGDRVRAGQVLIGTRRERPRRPCAKRAGGRDVG